MGKVLTISIASYNVGKTLERTVESIIEASECLHSIELIIVNDGSKDGTAEIAKSYAERYPKTVKMINKSNGGYGSTVNASLAIAVGKYYRLLDGDDTFETNNLSEYIRFLSNCTADIVISPYNEVYENSGQIELVDSHRLPVDINRFENIVMHEVAAKTDTLRSVCTQITEHCFYTDSEFVFYALMGAKSIEKFQKPIYNYYLGVEGQSVSIEGIKKHYKDMIKVSDKTCRLFADSSHHKEANVIQRKLIEDKIRIIVRNVYGSFLVLDNSDEVRKELKAYDLKIKKEFPEVYEISGRERKIYALRKSGFILFGLLSNREKKRF